MNGFEATEGGLRSPLAPLTPRSQEATEKPGLHTGEHQESKSQRTEYQLPQPWQVNQFPHALQWALWLLVNI